MILAVVSLGAGFGAGVLAKSFNAYEPEPYVPRTAAVKTDPVRERPVEQPVTETVAEELPAVPAEEEVKEEAPVQPKAVTTAKPVEKLTKEELAKAFNSGNGDEVRKFSKRFVNFTHGK